MGARWRICYCRQLLPMASRRRTVAVKFCWASVSLWQDSAQKTEAGPLRREPNVVTSEHKPPKGLLSQPKEDQSVPKEDQSVPNALEYYQAAICRRGHVIDSMIEPHVTRGQPVPAHCSECGAKVYTRCPSCDHPLPGALVGGLYWTPWKPKDFCQNCAHPLPWATREAAALHVENLLDEQPDLDPGDRRALEEELRSLRRPAENQAETSRQVEALKGLKKMAPAAFKAAEPALEVLLTAAMKAALGLPHA